MSPVPEKLMEPMFKVGGITIHLLNIGDWFDATYTVGVLLIDNTSGWHYLKICVIMHD
jgi:hypothetical protein